MPEETEVGTAFALGAATADDPVSEVAESDRRAFAVLPPGYSAHSLEHLQAVPNRVRSKPVFRDVQSLARYLERFETGASLGFADWRAHRLEVVIDYHGEPGFPSHCDHVASFFAEASPSWKKWRSMHDKVKGQGEFARFLEERAHEIVEPAPADVVDAAINLEAVRRVNFKSSVRLQSGARQFIYEEEDQQRGSVTLPEKITIRVPVFDGMEPDRIVARLRYRIDDGKLGLAITFDNLDEVERVAFERCRDALAVARSALLILNADTQAGPVDD